MDHMLAILNRAETAPAVLAAGRLIGKRLSVAPPILLHPRPDIDLDFMPTEEVMTPDRHCAFEAERDNITSQLARTVVAANWVGALRQVRGQVREIVAGEAGHAALVIAGAAGHNGHSEAQDTIYAVLFDARAPLLVVPETVPAQLGGSITVAWERSQAADEAVEAALPLLLAAERVSILVAEERHARVDLPGGIVAALDRAGTGAVIHRFGLAGRDIGDAILAEAGSSNADLLVMGAFTHLRTLEALFGGATREVMAGARIPLLLHH